MRALLRTALLVVIVFLLLGVVVGIASGETGAPEKVVLAGVGLLLVWAASLVRRRLA
jgi:hypothetical protein